jgi:2-desacetyl-2-hydroxyethyl bacteriochlorophyllide A dehydrogenase
LRGKESVGQVDYPFIPGYCLAGQVIATGPDANFAEGQPVITYGTLDGGEFALGEGGHVSYAINCVDLVVPVPRGVELLEASAAILAGIAFHGLCQSRPLAGEKVAVVGLGIIGQLTARLYAASGTRVVGCDLSGHRVRLVQAAGIEAFVPRGNLRDGFGAFFPEGADIVIDATGEPTVFQQAIQLVRTNPWDPLRDLPGSRCLIQGSYEDAFCVPYSAAYAGQVTILVPRGSQLADWRQALELLSQKRIRLRDLITEVRDPEAAQQTYAELQEPGTDLLTVAFRWD